MDKVLQGVVVPALTPLDDQEDVDVKSVHRLTERFIDHRVDGIFLLGTMGEFACVSNRQKGILVKETVKAARGRIRVFCGISDTGTRRVIENGRELQGFEVDGLVPLLPFYYPLRRTEENRKFLQEVLAALEKPIVYYENPVMTRRSLSYQDCQWLTQQKGCIGVKDSSGDVEKFTQLVKIFSERQDCGVLTGTASQSVDCFKAGADGLVPGLGSLAPSLCVSIYRAGMEKRWDDCVKLQEKYLRLQNIYGDGWQYWPAAHKTACRFLGIMDDSVGSPHLRLNDEEREFVRRILVEEGIL